MTIFGQAQILLIDDEPLVAEMFESILVEQGYEVSTASNSLTAAKILENQVFDLIISDVRLRPFSGFDLAAMARERMPDVEIILITGLPDPEDVVKARSLGYLYLGKPISFRELSEAVRGKLPRADKKRSGARSYKIERTVNKAFAYRRVVLSG